MAARRDISPFLQVIRDKLLRRKNVNFLRFADDVAPRTQPAPNLPPGPNSKLSCNYYYPRDGRREVQPAEVIVENGKRLITDGCPPKSTIERVPGRVFLWDK